MIEATCDTCSTIATLTDATLADRTCPAVPCSGYLVLTGDWQS